MSNEKPIPRLPDAGIIWLCGVFVLMLLGAGGCRTSATFASGAAPGERLASSRPGRLAGSKWEIGLPIAHYYQGPGANPRWGAIPEHANQLAKFGFNLVWCPTVEDLDAAHALGLRGLSYGLDAGKIDQPGGEAELAAYIDNVKDHPAMYGSGSPTSPVPPSSRSWADWWPSSASVIPITWPSSIYSPLTSAL